jgi:hypothetical protein
MCIVRSGFLFGREPKLLPPSPLAETIEREEAERAVHEKAIREIHEKGGQEI